MVVYTINTTSRSVYDWICTQPNLNSNPSMAHDIITVDFNHDATQQRNFKIALMKVLYLVNVDGVQENLYSYIEQLLGDQLVFVTESQQTKTNLGTAYVDVFPASITGNPIPIDTTGFTKVGIQLFWNKNSGVSQHDFRIVNNANVNQVLVEKTNITTTITEDFNIPIPSPTFINFIGKLRLQCKAGNATDDPIFLGCRIYLRR